MRAGRVDPANLVEDEHAHVQVAGLVGGDRFGELPGRGVERHERFDLTVRRRPRGDERHKR
jgi:hypothetical protein